MGHQSETPRGIGGRSLLICVKSKHGCSSGMIGWTYYTRAEGPRPQYSNYQLQGPLQLAYGPVGIGMDVTSNPSQLKIKIFLQGRKKFLDVYVFKVLVVTQILLKSSTILFLSLSSNPGLLTTFRYFCCSFSLQIPKSVHILSKITVVAIKWAHIQPKVTPNPRNGW